MGPAEGHLTQLAVPVFIFLILCGSEKLLDEFKLIYLFFTVVVESFHPDRKPVSNSGSDTSRSSPGSENAPSVPGSPPSHNELSLSHTFCEVDHVRPISTAVLTHRCSEPMSSGSVGSSRSGGSYFI